MPRRFRLLIHGSGFSVPQEGVGRVRGFYAYRRVLAETPREAEGAAIAALRSEEQVLRLLDTTEAQEGSRDQCQFQVDSVDEISWFAWHFRKYWRSFIFYGDEH
jgi:hypothetical protein